MGNGARGLQQFRPQRREHAGSGRRRASARRKDPILKERLFGLTNSEGNHGEDVKEYYFYLELDTDPLLHEVPLQIPGIR